MPGTLHIWDFDDTLVESCQTSSHLRDAYPHIPEWMWWHHPEHSLKAALHAAPILPMWQKVSEGEGDHIILTGRHQRGVLAWLGLRRVPEVAKIQRVVSTSRGSDQPFGLTAQLKARYVRSISRVYDQVLVYDDSQRNIRAISEVGGNVKAFRVQDGRILNPDL